MEQRGARRPVVLEDDGIGSSTSAASDPGRNSAAPFRQRRHWSVVVRQMGVAPEHALPRIEVVIEPKVELVLVVRLCRGPHIVVRRPAEIRQGVTLDCLSGELVKAALRNYVASEGLELRCRVEDCRREQAMALSDGRDGAEARDPGA